MTLRHHTLIRAIRPACQPVRQSHLHAFQCEGTSLEQPSFPSSAAGSSAWQYPNLSYHVIHKGLPMRGLLSSVRVPRHPGTLFILMPGLIALARLLSNFCSVSPWSRLSGFREEANTRSLLESRPPVLPLSLLPSEASSRKLPSSTRSVSPPVILKLILQHINHQNTLLIYLCF